MAKQSVNDRLTRLSANCCPIHGISMVQIGDWYFDENFDSFAEVGCPRADCDVTAMSYAADGPAKLYGKHLELIGQPAGPEPKFRPFDPLVADLGDKDDIAMVYRLAEEHGLTPYQLILLSARQGLKGMPMTLLIARAQTKALSQE